MKITTMTSTWKTAKTFVGSAALACALFGPATSHSAPGTLADSPLFLTNPVEPNILFTLDDSGSMFWGTMSPENNGVIRVGTRTYRNALPEPGIWDGRTPPTEEWLATQGVPAPQGGVWRVWNADYNRLHYDPAVRYTPWAGEDSSGALFQNAIPTAALRDPNNPAGGTLDLTARVSYDAFYDNAGFTFGGGASIVTNFLRARYYIWNDDNTNGIVDITDSHILVEIDPMVSLTYPGGPERSDCVAAPVCTYAEEIQNFANWYSYYRRRQDVAKAAYGRVIAGAHNARMGLVSLHNNNAINTAIESMNEDPTTGDKKALLDALYEMDGAGGTPLRRAFDESGEYLSCIGNPFGFGTSCPALAPSNGGECQQNFNILMTDGYYNGGSPSMANEDGNDDSAWDSGPNGPFGDNQNNTLADIAMHYYETDIRPGVANKLSPPPSGVDENRAQHMVTYSVAFGVEGTVTAMPPNNTDPFAWPVPNTDPRRIDDLRHAAWNGRGDFFSAQNPQQLVDGLRGALQSIQGRIGSSSSVAFNTGSLSTNSEVYLALFNSDKWNGDLLAYDLDPNSGAISSTPNWSAGNRLTSRNMSTSPRVILTYDGNDGTGFQWTNLTTTQKDDFRTNPSGGTDNDAVARARHGFVRGDRGCEFSAMGSCLYTDGANTYSTKALRERASRLGDIIHSGPVFAGPPESNWPDVAPFPSTTGNTYSEFRTANAGRQGVVYVGSNDGMLHAFDQATGDEIMAYVPDALYSTAVSNGLHYQSDPAYTHRYSVDLTASIADVYAKTSSSGSTSWKTVLVGSLRGGGRGIFALDVTDPGSFSESTTAAADTVMWEFTYIDDPDLGYTFSRPSIVPMEGAGGTIRWAAILGNGYNDLGSGEAKLFIVFLEDGLDGIWTAGSDYIEITTGVGDPSNRNGLSTPAVVDTDGNGLADRVYAGDLMGNLWAFDVSGATTSSWGVAYMSGTTPEPLFTAQSNQQITSTAVIVRNSSTPTSLSNNPNTLVIFGTGQYLTTADIVSTDTQSMYGVWDSGTSNLDDSDLVEQTLATGTTTGGVTGRTVTDNAVNYSTEFGWYMDLPDTGERLITDPVIRGGQLFFNTMIPDPNPCNFGGSGWLMIVDWINGGTPDQVTFDLNRDSQLDSDDEIGGEAAVGLELQGIATSPVNLANKRYTSTTETTGGSTIEVTDILEIDSSKTGRLSWEELTP